MSEKRVKVNRIVARLIEVGEQLNEEILDSWIKQLESINPTKTDKP